MQNKYFFDITILSVLVDEDEAQSLQALLHRHTHKVLSATTTEKGSNLFHSHRPDIIIIDLSFGVEAIERMLENVLRFHPYQHIIGVSGVSSFHFIEKFSKFMFDGCLFRPFNKELLLKKINKITRDVLLKKDFKALSESIDEKVQKQVEAMRKQDKILSQQTKEDSFVELIDLIAAQWHTPMNISTLYIDDTVELLKHHENSSKEIEANIKKIKSHILHYNETLGEFHSYFSQKSQRFHLNLTSMTHALLILHQDIAQHYGIQIQCEHENEIYCEFNPLEFKQILSILIENAKEAFISNKISSKKTIRILLSQTPNSVVLSVCDNAGGMQEEIVDKIFLKHFSTKSDAQSKGIGLFLLKQIVEKREGSISVHNSQNGVCFILEFPFKSSSTVS